MNFKSMMEAQASYNDKKFGIGISDKEKRDISKDLALNSYNSINRMIEKMRSSNDKPHEDDLVFSSIDVLRYVMSMLNLWGVDPDDVTTAFLEKDAYLEIEHEVMSRKWEGQPVIIVDIDDVVADFRKTFAEFLLRDYSLEVSDESEQYFFVNEILNAGNLNPEKVFESFVQKRHFRNIPLISGAKQFLTEMRDRGYWVQLLTARPKEDLKIFYDTYHWLKENEIPFDRIDFTPEKFRWCMSSEYYDSDSIEYAIDDSPKHALEYANHNMCVKVPLKSYNKSITNSNVTFYNDLKDLLK